MTWRRKKAVKSMTWRVRKARPRTWRKVKGIR